MRGRMRGRMRRGNENRGRGKRVRFEQGREMWD
jgi:hypothetical protein